MDMREHMETQELHRTIKLQHLRISSLQQLLAEVKALIEDGDYDEVVALLTIEEENEN